MPERRSKRKLPRDVNARVHGSCLRLKSEFERLAREFTLKINRKNAD
jgi:hypothetical protein